MPLVVSKRCAGGRVRYRVADGYVSASDVFELFDMNVPLYLRNRHNNNHFGMLSEALPDVEVVEIWAGAGTSAGIWFHPKMALNLGHWLSSKLVKLMGKWHEEWLGVNAERRQKDREETNAVERVTTRDKVMARMRREEGKHGVCVYGPCLFRFGAKLVTVANRNDNWREMLEDAADESVRGLLSMWLYLDGEYDVHFVEMECRARNVRLLRW